MKIAVIGTGISGLGAAYALSKAHEVELFERDRAGGHSNTVEHMVAGRTLALDTGFIVHNEDTYPNLVRLFRELGAHAAVGDELLGRLRPARPRVLGQPPAAHAADARDRPLPAPREPGSTTRAARSGAPVTSPRRATRRGSVTTSSSRSAPRSGRPLPARRSTSRSSTPSASSPTTGSSASGASAGRRSPAAARATCAPWRSGCASTSRPRSARSAASTAASSCGSRRRAAPLRRRRRRDPRRPGAAPARGSERGRAPPARRLRDDRERHRPAHGRALPAPPRRDPRLLELPAPRLRLRRRPPDDDLLPEQAPAPRRGRALLRHAEPHGRDRPGADHPPLLLPPPARDPGVDAPSPSCRA